ncbi:MAG: hypothetical protein IBX72_05690 [Nitrospirae bacterium]|nr:hypothetical protein [Nitrospirota bacterium]
MFILGIVAVFFILGCGGQIKELQMRDTNEQTKKVVFPKGTVLGGASKDQASVLAQIFVESHNNAMKETDEIKKSTQTLEGSTKRIEVSTQKIEGSTQKILESSQMNFETAQKTLMTIEHLSRSQGTGEITLFYPVASFQIKKGSLEYQRLVNFIDFLSQRSNGRKILFISIGSASAFGDMNFNRRLAEKRSDAPMEIIDKYLVNIPHEFYKVYGVGDVYSPKNVSMKEHHKYQSTRIIAFYETDQIPILPEPVEDKERFFQK